MLWLIFRFFSFSFIDRVSPVSPFSLGSIFKANLFVVLSRVFFHAAWLQTRHAPLLSDYESLRIGGLVFAVVLFLMGIALIVSKSSTARSAETLTTLWSLCRRWPRPRPRPRATAPGCGMWGDWGSGGGATKQASVCLGRAEASCANIVLALYTSSVRTLSGCSDPVILLSPCQHMLLQPAAALKPNRPQ